jgi:cobalt-precorrin-5B (C1)-methyltransferase
MSERPLRRGITTGTCAAAAAKAAVLAALGRPAEAVEVISPQGQTITVAIAASQSAENGGSAAVVKDAGDDPDITHGMTVSASIELTAAGGIVIRGGEGIGTVTKPGLSVPVGQPAINPGPRQMITEAVSGVLPDGRGAVVTVAIPGGRETAARTLNPVLGIAGGLSVIGTTGIVEPMSEEAWKTSLTPQISVVRALGHDEIVFVPGKIGQNIAINRCRLPADLVVQTSNFIGYMLENAARQGIKKVLLLGHPGKIVKVAAGIFHTHSRMADARMETLAAYAAAAGATVAAVEEILACTTTEAAMTVIDNHGLTAVWPRLARQASLRAERFVHGDLAVGTVIVTLAGDILGLDETAKEIGGSLGWTIK